MRGSVTAQGLRGSSRATPIVVPLDVEHLPPLPLWTAVATILYKLAIAVAAVHSL